MSLAVYLFLPLLGVAYVVYQLYLHPLAKYPGPVIGRLTKLYSLYHSFKSDTYKNLHDLHRRHGPIVRFGPNRISVNDVQAIEQIYGPRANVKKAEYYSVGYGVSIFNATDRQVHARKKRVMSNAFSEQALRDMEPYVLSTVRHWCSGLDGDYFREEIQVPSEEIDKQRAGTDSAKATSSWTPPQDMSKLGSCLTLDTLGEIAFGKSFETSRKPDMRWYFSYVWQNTRIFDICGQMPWLGRHGLDYVMRKGSAADHALRSGPPQKQLALRLAADPEDSKRRDILYHLMQARDPQTGEGYSHGELVAEIHLLLGAGTDTTATALAATFFFLLHHPKMLERLTREIRTTFADVEAIVKGPQLDGLVYLQACIDEAMRCCPPVPTCLPRQVLPGGLKVAGHQFPAGTDIGVPIYSMHYNEQYFDRPLEYDPTRWLLRGTSKDKTEGVDEEILQRQRQAFIPFSTGPRVCIARRVALMELNLGIARVLYTYDVRLAPGLENLGVGSKGEFKIKENFLAGKEGPMLQFRRVAA